MPIDFVSALLSIALTAAIFGAGPMLLRLRKTPISPKPLKYVHIGYTVIVALAFAVYDALNGYQINFFPALLWGSIFYWWNTRYFEKKFSPKLSKPSSEPSEQEPSEPPTPATVPPEPDPVLPVAPQQIEIELSPAVVEQPPAVPKKPEKPKHKPHVLTVVLCIALALSLAGNVWQGVSWASDSAESAEKIRVLNNKLTQKEEAISEYRTKVGDLNTALARANIQKEGLYDHLDAALFLYNNIGFIVDGSSYYHNYECPVFQAANEYWAHNIEYCQSIGYSACPVCWD